MVMEFPGFPGGGFDFGYAEAGAALAGLVVRDGSGLPRSGIIPSTANVITGRSDWNVDVAPFVVVRGDGPRVLLGGVDSSLQVAIAVPPASNSRIDLVYALARNVDAGDLAGCVHVVTGVPGPIPVKPSLPVGGVELGTVTVPATATGTSSSTIANTFKYTAAAGGVVPFRSVSELTAWVAADGQLAVDLSSGSQFQRVAGAWVGNGWTAYAPTWGSTSTPPTLGASTLVGWYRMLGVDEVEVKIYFKIGVGANGGTGGTFTFSLPFPAAPGPTSIRTPFPAHLVNAGVGIYVGMGYVDPAASVVGQIAFNASPGAVWGGGSGFTLNSEVAVSGTYRKA
ncbi:hypothetical protein ACIPY5_12070 [Microbacterium sp. NPDC089698]|uniref:hypothetical protein n=1 Tax=Microbacterium sp. NPDC089698 TaxID=3364200 RepID=UPI00382E5129